MKRVKVTEIRGAFAFEGVSYGPFQANNSTPYLEVPAALAAALNLPLHPDEVAERQEPQPSTEPAPDLTAARNQLDLLTQKLHRANDRIAFLEGELEGQKTEWEKQRGGGLADLAASLKREDALKAKLGDGEVPADAPLPQPEDGTPLPDGILHRDLLMAGGFTSLEKLAAGLQVADGESESQVQKLEGVGKKTVQAYEKLIADWQASRA